MASYLNLPLRRNKSTTFAGTARKRTGDVSTAIDLTGATLTLTVKKAIGADADMFELTSAASSSDGSIEIHPDQVGSRGEYTVLIEPAATDDASEFPDDRMGYYPLEIVCEEASGEIVTLGYGHFAYSPDVP